MKVQNPVRAWRSGESKGEDLIHFEDYSCADLYRLLVKNHFGRYSLQTHMTGSTREAR